MKSVAAYLDLALGASLALVRLSALAQDIAIGSGQAR